MRPLYLMLLAALLCTCSKNEPAPPFHAIDVSWQHPQTDFTLTDVTGKARTLAEFRGKVVVLFFGYTHCPEVCPTTLADLSQLMRLLNNEAQRVQVIFVTLDAERDTPAILAKYLPAFDSSFIGLYGDAVATNQAAQKFGVNYARHAEANGGYSIDHTDSIYLVGTRGTPLLRAPYGQPAEQLAEDIRRLLSIGR